MPYHCEVEIDFELPKRWAAKTCWAKADMIYSLSFERADLFSLGRGEDGRRVYQTATISKDTLTRIQESIAAGLGL
jgi:uncharacterized protein YifN (PemK superfamily)